LAPRRQVFAGSGLVAGRPEAEPGRFLAGLGQVFRRQICLWAKTIFDKPFIFLGYIRRPNERLGVGLTVRRIARASFSGLPLTTYKIEQRDSDLFTMRKNRHIIAY
jgi:hypothetical protein